MTKFGISETGRLGSIRIAHLPQRAFFIPNRPLQLIRPPRNQRLRILLHMKAFRTQMPYQAAGRPNAARSQKRCLLKRWKSSRAHGSLYCTTTRCPTVSACRCPSSDPISVPTARRVCIRMRTCGTTRPSGTGRQVYMPDLAPIRRVGFRPGRCARRGSLAAARPIAPPREWLAREAQASSGR